MGSGKTGRTIVEKTIASHAIHEMGGRTLLYLDHVIAADTALYAFKLIKDKKYGLRHPAQNLHIPDHYTPSIGPRLEDLPDVEVRTLIADTERAGRALGLEVFGIGDVRRGIQHTVSVEQAYAQPGVTIGAADSHTSTQGAVGAMAFSIGTDLPHGLATQCVWFKRPKMMRVNLEGRLAPHVTAKDVIMTVCARLGSGGAVGYAVEYAGSFIRNLPIEGRMTVCNMTAEVGGRLGIVGPDEVTFAYLKGRPYAPSEKYWDRAVAFWRGLASDPDAVYDRELTIDVSTVEPMVSWGNNTENAVPISGVVPDPSGEQSPERRTQIEQSLAYMGLQPKAPLKDLAIDQVFIGSCANSTLSDLRTVAEVMGGRKVAVPTLIVPGSGLVKAQAEAEGLAAIFKAAGATWGESGCSMCCSQNGDTVPAGARCAATSNRNHMGRQGRGSRTHLVSPATAAAAAVTGRLVDVRTWSAH